MDAGQLTARIAAAMTLAQSSGYAVAAAQLDAIRAELGAQLAQRIGAAVATVAATTAKPWLRGLSLSIGYAATAEGVPVELLVPMADNRLYEDKGRVR